MACRLGRLSTSATRRLPLCGGVRSIDLPGRGIGPGAQFVGREAEATKDNSGDNTRIDGPYRRLGYRKAYYWPPADALCVSERKSTSLSRCLQSWKADIYPKPDHFFYYHDGVLGSYCLEEDGTISPKYYIYPPSFLAKYTFMGSCNGLFHFHEDDLGHVLWNPTTSEYKILPKPFVELHPIVFSFFMSNGMSYDHRSEDFKVMHPVRSYLEDQCGYGCRNETFYIDLYSLKTDSWRRIPCIEFKIIALGKCVCVSGVFYCTAYQKGTPEDKVLLTFDFSTETISTLPLPNFTIFRYIILKYKGLLSALEWWYDDDDGGVPWKYELSIMRDGSWRRESVFYTRGVRELLWFSQDGKLLYFATLSDELVVFDRATGKLKHLGVNWFPSELPKIIPFHESFVQLNGISHVEEKHEQKKEKKEEDVVNHGSGD